MTVTLRRLPISLKSSPALIVERMPLDGNKMVYMLVQDRKHTYRTGRSRVVYIGTTRNGRDRIAQSAAFRADADRVQRILEDLA